MSIRAPGHQILASPSLWLSASGLGSASSATFKVSDLPVFDFLNVLLTTCWPACVSNCGLLCNGPKGKHWPHWEDRWVPVTYLSPGSRSPLDPWGQSSGSFEGQIPSAYLGVAWNSFYFYSTLPISSSECIATETFLLQIHDSDLTTCCDLRKEATSSTFGFLLRQWFADVISKVMLSEFIDKNEDDTINEKKISME